MRCARPFHEEEEPSSGHRLGKVYTNWQSYVPVGKVYMYIETFFQGFYLVQEFCTLLCNCTKPAVLIILSVVNISCRYWNICFAKFWSGRRSAQQ